MLQLTRAAAQHIDEARRAQGLPESVGLRVFGEAMPDGRISLRLAFTEEPAAGDEVDEQDETRLFVAPEVAEPLASAELDIEPDTPEGPQLVLREQTSEVD